MVTLTAEQAQQIEEALDKLNSVYGLHETPCVAKALATISAARAREQAEQAPVARVVDCDLIGNPIFGFIKKPLEIGTKLYAAPVRTKELTDELQQKCSDWGTYWRASDAHGVNLSIEQATELLRDALGVEVEITHPVRTKDLTDDEIEAIVDSVGAHEVGCWQHVFARAVIAADREKNR